MRIEINKIGALPIPTLLNYAFLALVLLLGFLSMVFNISGIHFSLVVIMFCSVFLAINSKQNYLKFMLHTPILFWIIWCVYNFLNLMIIGVVNTDSFFYFVLSKLAYPILTMTIVYFEGCKNLKRTSTIVLSVMSFYVIGGLLFQGDATREGWGDDERGGGVMGNALPLNACILTFFSLFGYFNGWISKKLLCLLLVSSLAAIFIVATRKAIGGWCLIVLMSLFKNFDVRKPSTLFKLFLLLVAICVAYQYVMDYTHLGERIKGTEEQGEYMNESDVEQLNFLGDRALQYVMAWDLFLENPITGIGLFNFQIVADFPFVLHSEYMVQLCECGIIGSVFFLCFMGGLIAKIINMYKHNSGLFLLFVGGILCMLFINVTAWTYQGCAYFAMYGVILASCRQQTANVKHLAEN